MAKFEYIEWLMLWLLRTNTFRFDWDEGNRFKSALKHGVSIEEVEEIFKLGLALPLGIQVTPEVNEPRYAIVGPTRSSKMFTLVFTLRQGKVRPISVRPAHKKEREAYEKVLRQIAERV